MIPCYLIEAGGNRVVQIDDPATDTDLGASYTARLVTIQFAQTAWSMFRQFTQELFITTSATIKLTPINDGSESGMDSQSQSFTSAVDGAINLVILYFNKFGTRFQVAIEVTAHVGITELGSFSRRVVPRRSYR